MVARTLISERNISLGPGLAAIPERLLLAHARGDVLIIAGAGVSRPSSLPDFRGLVLEVYRSLDPAVHGILTTIPSGACNQWEPNLSSLNNQQAAEVRRFVSGDYDVVLGLLERRIDGRSTGHSKMRGSVVDILQRNSPEPGNMHRILLKLADRGGSTTIVTTNFDLLFEDASTRSGHRCESYSLGGIPRPGRSAEFAGVLHIHGALERKKDRAANLVLSDQDFGEYYLRRRVVPDLIYDAARLFHIVLIGYSANDPPMRYLLNAVAADGARFKDLKERFTFVGTSTLDPIVLEDWRGRGITPIPYHTINHHSVLLDTLKRWATLSAINGKSELVDAEIKKIVKKPRSNASEASQDLFDHFIRRTNSQDRVRIADMISKAKADIGWLDALRRVATEADHGLQK